MIEENRIWSGLQIVNGIESPTTAPEQSSPRPRREVITQIPVADRFDDYGPARPEDFVGRTELQSDIMKFFEKVRLGQTHRRVISLYGPSGFGKSSVILKLADKTQNKRYRNKFYLYHIDSRSAASPLFVAEAIKAAFQQAIKDQFVNLPELQISIDSVEDPFSSASIQACLSYLKSQERVLSIFFDQFEELLTKEDLFGTFDVLKKIAFLVESLQSNLILGFSWRTGISFPEDHPAYHMWHSLQDKRAEFKIGLFSNKEAVEMVGILEKYLGEKLENTLRRNLLEQAQGFPWLLKKFCVHVYRQLSSGSSQRSLVGRQMDAAILFDEDTRNLSANQLSCLKYIAENSPVDLLDVQESFDPDVIDFLYHNRLIIKSGYKYSVYWDIFREYLISENVPRIPMTYFPQAQLTTSLSVLRFILKKGPISIEEIEAAFNYTIKTIWNIVGDLSAFFLIKRNNVDKLEAVDEFRGEANLEKAIATYVAEQLERHIVTQIFYKSIQPGEGINLSDLERLIANEYPSTALTSIHAYMNRIVSWLQFTGLIEIEPPEQIIRPLGEGKDKGKVVIRHTHLIDRKAIFLCTAGPNRVIDLATELCQKEKLSRREILEYSNRNAAQDLTALGLAQWKGSHLRPTGELINITKYENQDIRTQCTLIIKQLALRSRFLTSLITQFKSISRKTEHEIFNEISQELGRDWHPSSAKRYLGGGKRWLEYFGEFQKLQGQMSLWSGNI